NSCGKSRVRRGGTNAERHEVRTRDRLQGNALAASRRGSTFTFDFSAARSGVPASTSPSEDPATPPARGPADGPLSGMHVMLVEDSIDSQRLLSTFLSLEGADVTVSADGVDAVTRFDGTFAPDLVLMDVQLPGIDGIEAMSRIRARGYRGRIAALTAAALGAERERAAAAGCERIALKPISRADLVALCVGAAPAHA
ncbi:MAG: response regulator, partial [Phycisphaerales bacterium]